MPKSSRAPSHHCRVCGKPLWKSRWPYALCNICSIPSCPHGNAPQDCQQCLAESDRAYDAARER